MEESKASRSAIYNRQGELAFFLYLKRRRPAPEQVYVCDACRTVGEDRDPGEQDREVGLLRRFRQRIRKIAFFALK